MSVHRLRCPTKGMLWHLRLYRACAIAALRNMFSEIDETIQLVDHQQHWEVVAAYWAAAISEQFRTQFGTQIE